jgi:spermidine synthase
MVRNRDCIENGWFIEKNPQWPGVANALQVEQVLFEKQSPFQDVMVFKSTSFGNVLILDGVIQLTERDEMSYQEMMSHVPLFAHPNPKRVLVVGGGDGGIIREVVKHKGVEIVYICEIDQVVIDAGKEFFPTVASAWSDPRVHLICDDASKFITDPKNKGFFDVVISDTSDPVGPAQPLFEKPFYQNLFDALRPGGRVCCQGESMWLHLNLIKKLVSECGSPFEEAAYAWTQIPSYPCGQIGLLVCTKASPEEPNASSKKSNRLDAQVTDNCRFYSHELHQAAFVVPAFVKRALDQK